jgi:hypothetical protein
VAAVDRRRVHREAAQLVAPPHRRPGPRNVRSPAAVRVPDIGPASVRAAVDARRTRLDPRVHVPARVAP